jgi:putative effector of murein hydrolase LrgA (UPF0299 family)
MRRATASENHYLGDRAIVVGSGLAGLSAARALSDRFRQVLILDRDELPNGATPRSGVPQDKQPHGLLRGGLEALEQLFPGFGNELRQAGAVPFDQGFDVLNEIAGEGPWPRIKLDRPTYSMSRPLIELTLRRQVEGLRNVEVRGGSRVLNIIGASDTGAATDICYRRRDGKVETLQSDLIIDASGNGSLTLQFLKASGRRLPKETSIGVNMRYASALFEKADIQDGYKIAYTFPDAPAENRGGLIMLAENGTYQVVLIGRGEDIPPINEIEFRRYARDLRTPTIYNAIKHARRLHVPIPENVLGLFVLLLGFYLRLISPQLVEDAAKRLLFVLPALSIPLFVSAISRGQFWSQNGWALLAAIVLATAGLWAFVGHLAQHLLRKSIQDE